jgi:hypothetical protein
MTTSTPSSALRWNGKSGCTADVCEANAGDALYRFPAEQLWDRNNALHPADPIGASEKAITAGELLATARVSRGNRPRATPETTS